MKIIIAGGGLVGKGLIHQLSSRHDVVVIEQNLKKCELLDEQYPVVTFHGDAKDMRLLRAAGIEKADCFLAVTGTDADNMVLTLLAKDFGVKNRFVVMHDPDYESVYRAAGATLIAPLASMVIHKLTLEIEHPEIRRVASMGEGKAEIVIIDLPEDSIHVGKSISTIGNDPNFPEDCIIAGLFNRHTDEFIIPRGYRTLDAGYQLFLVGSAAVIAKAFKYFNETK